MDLDLHSRRCAGTAVSTDCGDITTTHTLTRGRDIDYVYLVKGSRVAFNGSQISDVSRYFIWMFTTLQAADQAVHDDFDTISCGSPPPDTLCMSLRPHQQPLILYFDISLTSYYFIRCGNLDSKCSQLGEWELSVVAFNPPLTQPSAIDRVNLTSDTVTLRLRNPFYPVVDTSGVCVLAQLEESLAAECGEEAQVYVSDLSRRLDILLYPGVVSAITLFLITLACICMCYIQKRK